MEKSINEKRALSEDCKYSYVMAVVKRAKQIRRRAKEKNIPLNEIATVKTNCTKPLTVALEEFNAGNVSMKLKVSSNDSENEKDTEPIEIKTPEEGVNASMEEKAPEIPAETV